MDIICKYNREPAWVEINPSYPPYLNENEWNYVFGRDFINLTDKTQATRELYINFYQTLQKEKCTNHL